VSEGGKPVPEGLSAALADRYRITREVGQGGMATVYLAEDLKHDRRVALKVLKPELAAAVGADRFLAEIRTTANLQHPHILPLFDSGEAGGLLYYVMPYVEGESLRDRLDREGQLPVADAVRIATGVGEALDYAHRQGVVHRDVKPANVLLVDHKPLVSDFGIALATGGDGGRLTETGLRVGTLRYMSPEQATGEGRVGPTSDVYALGCVLYEMLVGEPPFTGPSPRAVLGRKMGGAWDHAATVRPAVPPHVDAVIRCALERTPADRFPSAARFVEALSDPGFRYGPDGRPDPGRSRRGWVVAVVAAAAAGVMVGRSLLPEEPAAGPLLRYQPTFGHEERPLPVFGSTVAVSADGDRIAYVGPSRTGGTQIFTRRREDLASRAVPGSQDGHNPFLSPDGTRVGFVTAARELKVSSLDGSNPLTLVGSGVLRMDPGWGGDGYIYFSHTDSPGLMRVRSSGASEPEPVYRGPRDPDVLAQHSPQLLPGSRRLLVGVVSNWGRNHLAILDLASGQLERIVDAEAGAYTETGHLVWATIDGSFLAAPFDPQDGRFEGDPVLLRELGRGVVDLTVAREGRLVYARAPASENRVVWVDRDGTESPIDPDAPIRDARFLSLSPDGSRLAVSTVEEESRDLGQVWIKELPRGPYGRLTFEGDVNFRPEWSPDGSTIVFISNRGGSRDAWRRRPDGASPAELILDLDLPVDEVAVAPDGEWLIYRRGSQNGERQVHARRLGQEESDIQVSVTRFDAFAPALSPDGRWVAFASDVDGETDIYVRPFPSGQGQWRVSRSGGVGPIWTRGGRELLYMGGNDSLMAVDVAFSPDPVFSGSRGLFPIGAYRAEIYHRSYDATPDGERFTMIRLRSQALEQLEVVAVENFHSELRDHVPN
jgi:Tol biopolymer transport system component/tRNA A-37 threonylcarbamoyl transferase component Bud32